MTYLPGEESVVMASELFPKDSCTAACPGKREHGDTYCGTGVAMSPTKWQKKAVLGEKQVKDEMPEGGTTNSHDNPFVKEEGDLRGKEGEPLTAIDGRGNAGDETGSANLDPKVKLSVSRITSGIRHQLLLAVHRSIPELITNPRESYVLSEGYWCPNSPKIYLGDQSWMISTRCCVVNCFVEAPAINSVSPGLPMLSFDFFIDSSGNLEIAGVVEQLPPQTHPPMSGATGIPNSERGDIDVDKESMLAADAPAAGGIEGGSSRCPCSDGSESDDSEGPGRRFGLASLLGRSRDKDPELSKEIHESGLLSSVRQRQDDDPELKKKIHKVETDYWVHRNHREDYNERRFELYTEEERERARIVWPEPQSPAGYRDQMLESMSLWEDGSSLDDEAYKCGVPLPLQHGDGGDDEAAKKRLRDKIEAELEDLEARRAEIERREEIRKVETEYFHERLSRKVYNKRRFALYTEAERKENCVNWPIRKSVRSYSPAGFRDVVFERRVPDEPELPARMAFHYPFSPLDGDPSDVGYFCKLCIGEHAAYLVRCEKDREKQKEEDAKRLLRLEKRAKITAESTIPCAACNKKFSTEAALTQHTAAKHHGL